MQILFWQIVSIFLGWYANSNWTCTRNLINESVVITKTTLINGHFISSSSLSVMASSFLNPRPSIIEYDPNIQFMSDYLEVHSSMEIHPLPFPLLGMLFFIMKLYSHIKQSRNTDCQSEGGGFIVYSVMSLCSIFSRPFAHWRLCLCVADCFWCECSNSCPCANILRGLIRPGAHLYSSSFGISGQLSYSLIDVVQFAPTALLPVLFY